VLGFLSFNYFFLPPYDTFVIGRGEYVVVLFVFLGISVFVSVLVARATSRAEAAERRERELRTQQDLTSALVDPRPGTESYGSVLRLVVATFGYRAATLMEQAPNGGLDEVVSVGDRAEEGLETGSVDRLPLTVGRRSLGLLVLEGDRPSLEPSERRILDAFSNQLALLLERDRALRAAIVSQRAP
jgi:two-component system sensor histidine kinase KdpD